MEDVLLRIGALSRRVGVSPELLRAWERRYGVLQPRRTDGGFRLYSADDERRVRTMLRHVEAGVPAAEAARLALAEEPASGDGSLPPRLEALAAALRESLDRFDEPAANLALDRLLGAFTVETVLRDVVVPYLRELGERWERGDASVAQEHFASNLLRGRLLGLARGWGRRSGPAAVLACAPGELHDLPLIVFGVVLAIRGNRVTFLGPDTPVATVAETARDLDAQLVVISATTRQRLARAQPELRSLASSVPVALAGAGASPTLAREVGARLLDADPVSAAQQISDGLA
jgi:DNA-binding transcriptional MerR regulator